MSITMCKGTSQSSAPWIFLFLPSEVTENEYTRNVSYLLHFYSSLSCTTVLPSHSMTFHRSCLVNPVQSPIQLSLSNLGYFLLLAFCLTLINCWQLINYGNSCFSDFRHLWGGMEGFDVIDTQFYTLNTLFNTFWHLFQVKMTYKSITIFIVSYCIRSGSLQFWQHIKSN